LLITPNVKRVVWAMLATQALSLLIVAFRETNNREGAIIASGFFISLNGWLA
jgi:hypothetical protein